MRAQGNRLGVCHGPPGKTRPGFRRLAAATPAELSRRCFPAMISSPARLRTARSRLRKPARARVDRVRGIVPSLKVVEFASRLRTVHRTGCRLRIFGALLLTLIRMRSSPHLRLRRSSDPAIAGSRGFSARRSARRGNLRGRADRAEAPRPRLRRHPAQSGSSSKAHRSSSVVSLTRLPSVGRWRGGREDPSEDEGGLGVMAGAAVFLRARTRDLASANDK